MFREMRRFKQALSEEKCLQVLHEEWRGVLSVIGDDGYPYGVPLDFYYEEGKLYFHCALEGHKLDAIRNCDKASFCVLDKGMRVEGDWALYFNSVICFGRIRVMEDRDAAAVKVRALAEKCFPDKSVIDADMARNFARANVLEFTIEHMSGKRVHEN